MTNRVIHFALTSIRQNRRLLAILRKKNARLLHVSYLDNSWVTNFRSILVYGCFQNVDVLTG